MRTKHALTIVACLAAALGVMPVVRCQDAGLQPYYWPVRTVGIPIRDVDSLMKQPNKISDVQLYYSLNRGPFQKGPRVALNKMSKYDSGSRGLDFTSPQDGDYEFAVQWINADGTANPPFEDLRPQQRIIIDTTPPTIKITPFNNGVDWVVKDDNLDPRKIVLKCRWPGTRDWTVINDRPLQVIDRFGWQLQPGKALEVRLEAEDKAGHRSVSQVVRVPPDGAIGASLPRTGVSAPSGIGAPSGPAPRIEYVNTLKFDVDYTIQHMGRSGIQAAHLFVMRNQGNWELVKRFPVKIMPGDKDQSLSLPYEVKDEGTYGFYVIPESGAGKRADDPRKDDAPLVWVVVDTTPPSIKITDVRVKPGGSGSRGPLVEITWEASDANLMPQPISLEWSPDRNSAKWNEIKYRLENLPGSTMGRYSWEVPDENLWKFWIRARAVDKASNSNEYVWDKEVIVDLEQPSVGNVKVRGGNSIPSSTTPSQSPKSTLPESYPQSGPQSAPTIPVPPQTPPGQS